MGVGGHVVVDMQEVPARERSKFPVRNVDEALSLCFQQSHLAALATKRRRIQVDWHLKILHQTYLPLLEEDFALDSTQVTRHGFGNTCADMLALQKQTLASAKKQLAYEQELAEEDPNYPWMLSGAAQREKLHRSTVNEYNGYEVHRSSSICFT